MASIKQINISYAPVEDRLLLRMTADVEDGRAEFKIWLTRRFVRLLWQTLAKIVDYDVSLTPGIDPENRESMKQFHQANALEKTDFSTPYSDDAVHTPLGKEPLLVSRIKCRRQAENLHVLTLEKGNNVGVNLSLDTTLTISLQKLLMDTAAKAEWNLDFMSISGKLPPSGQAVH